MKKSSTLILIAFFALTVTFGCKENPRPPQGSQAAATPAAMPPSAPQAKAGTVVETMNSGGYTYVQVDTGSEKIWAAVPEMAVKVGDSVLVPEGMPMTNHHSKTLNRDFELIYFVDTLLIPGAETASGQPQMPQGHPPIKSDAADGKPQVDVSGVKKAEGGKTVGEIYAQKDELTGKEVKLRGKVVKFSPQIMGKNWIHLQDGSGAEGSNDLTVTTSNDAQVGDTVLVSGLLITNKDFGFGYKYDVMVEDAKIIVE